MWEFGVGFVRKVEPKKVSWMPGWLMIQISINWCKRFSHGQMHVFCSSSQGSKEDTHASPYMCLYIVSFKLSPRGKAEAIGQKRMLNALRVNSFQPKKSS